MSFNLVPFGTYRSYTFTLNAKGRTLQSLRLTRRRDWYDLNSF
jgi:folate-binding Fe-S cluster repair protein YgfZ